MGAAMDTSTILEILSETFIKPSSPTLSSSTCHKLSSKEQIMYHEFIPQAFFYPFDHHHHFKSKQTAEISLLVQTSLQKTLTYYYPFAGRLTKNLFVDCNDARIQFTEARINCSMSEALNPPNSPVKDLVFSRCLFSAASPKDGSLLFVQVSYFDCGGIAVGLCISHKVSDASTRCTFSNDWAAVARQSSHVPTPKFNVASVFRPTYLNQWDLNYFDSNQSTAEISLLLQTLICIHGCTHASIAPNLVSGDAEGIAKGASREEEEDDDDDDNENDEEDDDRGEDGGEDVEKDDIERVVLENN